MIHEFETVNFEKPHLLKVSHYTLEELQFRCVLGMKMKQTFCGVDLITEHWLLLQIDINTTDLKKLL